METDYQRIEKAIEYIHSNFKTQPDLELISKELNLSPFYFQKLFKSWAGISPKKFLEVLTVENIKTTLKDSKNILESTYDAGLSSSSRTHDLFFNIEAMTPGDYKNSGINLTIYYGFHESIFGLCLIGVTDKGICSLHFVNSSFEEALKLLKHDWKNANFIHDESKTLPYFNQIFNQDGRSINIFLKGTNFQIQVWKALLEIPEGQLTSYEDIARKIGSPKAVRAVGTAVGHNQISYLIPCHRVINKIGVIGNYRWGTNRKKAILGFELSKS